MLGSRVALDDGGYSVPLSPSYLGTLNWSIAHSFNSSIPSEKWKHTGHMEEEEEQACQFPSEK